MPDFVTDIWNTVFFNPMLNGLVVLYGLSLKDLGLTIAVFTVIIRLIIRCTSWCSDSVLPN